ncbi:zinc/manganese ABC transporter substrate binding domain protein [Rickettsia felis str. Pedreira]|uniref:Zinc/manganese ABC transporter substrate binding domain protein n=1 Tax=Rickettsia felis str. Pedreira TaxID=1359196 RepID=A0A0F3MVC3_RICFI|nr:zinc/manganese ABC transporter substrate binding domain protein [Rickettsia felis str. Pedreira]
MRGKIENFDEAISHQNPEIATLLSVARNDNFIISHLLQPY